ncbi:MAG: hypothetical protein DI603_02080 [Roseateles depolymerans]|uniref:Uncharacterized protein n=1 Tax=Roseateles depolymerans TaxID=76731 RepID=A0A2W5E5M3_9BURK|nr:MAG: hypothetical protein DI603_02080 [Roseateles depolymerans]
MLEIRKCNLRSFALALCCALTATLAKADAPAGQELGALVFKLVANLNEATQATADGDLNQQRAAEQAVANQLRQLISQSPGDPAFRSRDHRWRTPLINAAMRGYADVVEALLSDEGVRQSINTQDGDGVSAWIAAQYARPLTLAACHPQDLTIEAIGLWGPYLQRLRYFALQTPLPFDRIRSALGAAGAKPELDKAKQLWLKQCPEHAPELEPLIEQSSDLMQTLLNDANQRLQGFFADPRKAPKSRQASPGIDSPTNTFPATDPVSDAQSSGAKHTCKNMPKPEWINNAGIPWTGRALFSIDFEVQDGAPVVARVTTLSAKPALPDAIAIEFRAMTLRALGAYRCTGDHLVRQEFEYRMTD